MTIKTTDRIIHIGYFGIVGDGAGEGEATDMVMVCVLLQSLYSPLNTYGIIPSDHSSIPVPYHRPNLEIYLSACGNGSYNGAFGLMGNQNWIISNLA